MNIPNTLNMILEHIYQGKNNGLCNLPINENNAIKKMSFKIQFSFFHWILFKQDFILQALPQGSQDFKKKLSQLWNWEC